MKVRIPTLILMSFLTDRISKQQVELGYLQDQTVLGGHVAIEQHQNPGLALGVKQEDPQKVQKLSLIGIGATAFLYCITDKKRRLTKTGLALMLGGGLGNFYDRCRNGAVTDFLRLPRLKGRAGKIIFNVADVWIFLGGLLTVIGRSRK